MARGGGGSGARRRRPRHLRLEPPLRLVRRSRARGAVLPNRESEDRQPDREGVHIRRPRVPRLHRHRGRPSAGGGTGLDGARGAVLSRNGRRLYVAASADASLAVFKRDLASGALSYLGCMTANAKLGPQGNGACSKVLRTGSRRGYGCGPYKVSQLLLSPDGRWPYGLDVGDDAVSRFRIR